ncbi:MAG: GMC family oxidoreductase [Pseudomonadota bacterium]
MKLQDALIGDSEEVFDAIVIGSGMTGGWAAKELCERGLKTLLVERGRVVEHRRDYPGEGVPPWSLPERGKVTRARIDRDYAVQSQNYAFSETTRHFYGNDRDLPYSTPADRKFRWIRGNQLGGKSLMWARQCYRWSAHDFAANATDGHGTAWPITYEELAPWYAYVERFVGISGAADGLDHLPDSVCQPPFEMTQPELTFRDRVRAKFPERHVIMSRIANLTEPTEEQTALGRSACQARNQCGHGCSFGAYFSTQSATLPAALATARLHIAPHSVVHSLIYDHGQRRVRGVRVIDEQTLQAREYHGRLVFLCASTLGSTQLLLNSANRHYPQGLANRSGVVGRFLMDHNYNASISARIPGYEEEYYAGRRPGGIVLPNIHFEPKRYAKGFARGYLLTGGSYREGWKMRGQEAGFGETFKARLGQPGPWRMQLYSQGETLPRADNQVALHPTLKDKWGIPQLHISCAWSPNEHAMMEHAAQTGEALMRAAGYEDVKSHIASNPLGTGVHETGTARMGDDPASSAFNRWNQAHGIDNLFCTDGASFCSIATQNPSLTMMALTVRAVDYAVRELTADRLG